jgi:hypothetical protein
MNGVIVFLCCSGAYLFVVFGAWALVAVGSRYDDEIEQAWLERITGEKTHEE